MEKKNSVKETGEENRGRGEREGGEENDRERGKGRSEREGRMRKRLWKKKNGEEKIV